MPCAGSTCAVGRGELIAVRGRSGSGKTTLLNVLGGLDRPTAGRVDDRRASSCRRWTRPSSSTCAAGPSAYIFQAFGLIPILSAAENVEVPLRLVAAEPRERDRRVYDLLELVGLGRAGAPPAARAVGRRAAAGRDRPGARQPARMLLLADEPTGQLDSETGHTIMTLIRTVVRTEGVTAVVATHDPAMLDVADRVVELRDGRLAEPHG